MNGGKVYYVLNDNLNNNIIKMIQKYLIKSIKVDIIHIIETFRITSDNLPKFTLLNKLRTVNLYLPQDYYGEDDYREDE
jgi:hypothetical protein